MKKKDVNELKRMYVGNIYNKLTITDIYYNTSNKIWYAVCICECGSKCDKCLNKVLSGHTKTCGGSVHKKEQGKQYSEWAKQHSDIIKQNSEKIKEWYKLNPDKVEKRSENHRKWWKENKDKLDFSDQYSENIRKNTSYNELLPFLHPDYYNDLKSGIITSHDLILTRCPKCGEYDKHELHSIYIIRDDRLKYGHAPLCRKCNMSRASHYELSIADLVSEFYKGELIKNARHIISPFELDLYYPDRHIAIEFNGDYWHNEEHKSKDYHYNKFKACLNKGIVLVSIFEHDWKIRKDAIMNYIKDLFNNVENDLSYIDENTVDLNYPPPNFNVSDFNSYKERSYTVNNRTTYTCGYAIKALLCQEL